MAKSAKKTATGNLSSAKRNKGARAVLSIDELLLNGEDSESKGNKRGLASPARRQFPARTALIELLASKVNHSKKALTKCSNVDGEVVLVAN